MELIIETVTIKLLDELYKIEKLSFTQEAFTKREIAWYLADYNTIGLAARLNSEIAGFLIARIEREKAKMFGHILTLDVAPSRRRLGIARRLLGELEKLLSQKGIRECRLEVKESNVAAINLYLKLGYKKMSRLEKYYGDAHGLYFQKSLNGSQQGSF